jgi:hypothetical protein
MFNAIKAAFMNASAVQAPASAVQAPAKAKAPRKARAAKVPSALEAAREERMAGYSLTGADKAQTEAFGPAFEATVHAFARKENEASDSMRGVAVKLNVMLSKPGDNAHWSDTTDDSRAKVNKAVRERFILKYQEVKVARNGKPPTRNTVRSLYNKVVALAKEEAGYTAKTNETGTGNAKDYADFALQNATTAYKRGYRIPSDKRDAKDTTAMELYGSIIAHYQGATGLKAVQKAVNDSLKPKAPVKVPAKGTNRKPRTSAKASYPGKTKV